MTIDWREAPGRYIKDPRLGHRLGRSYPAGEPTNQEWNLTWLGTDSEGFIYNDLPARDFAIGDTNFRRIFMFGGSTLMGLGAAKNQDTIPSVLERELQREHPLARTVNCGCGSYGSWQQLVYLSMELIVHRPDVIISMDGYNDFVHSSWGNKGYKGKWIPNTQRSLDDIVSMIQLATGEASIWELIRRKLLKIPAIAVLRTDSKYSFRQGVWEDPDYRLWLIKPESFEYYATNIRSTIGMGRANGAKIVHLLQPQLIWGGARNPTKYEREMLDRITSRMPRLVELAPKWFEEAKRTFAQLKSEFHDGSTIWIEDASDWLDNTTESVYHDYNHYSAAGQKIIAARMCRIVQQMWQTGSVDLKAKDYAQTTQSLL